MFLSTVSCNLQDEIRQIIINYCLSERTTTEPIAIDANHAKTSSQKRLQHT